MMKRFNQQTLTYSDHLRQTYTIALSVFSIGFIIRFYEIFLTSTGYILPDHTPSLYLQAVIFDLFYFAFLALLFALIFLVFRKIHKKSALWVTASIASIYFMIHLALVQYFGEGLILLGSDLYAYDFRELSDTVQTSVDFTADRWIPLLLVPVLFFLFTYLFNNIFWSLQTALFAWFAILILALSNLFMFPSEDNYASEFDYNIISNKTAHFVRDSANFLMERRRIRNFTGPEYPLLREPDTEDVLGSFFNSGDRSPNIVIIMIESFGGTMMPPHDRFGGFTPFLDSLAANSLYWTHFLATSGRSFNMQPSMLGSLPYGEKGFMDLGYMAPEHHTLISILGDNGYLTNYFSGYDTRFDKLDQFLERQNIHLLINSSRFPDEYEIMDEIEGGFTWGYSDKDTYRRAFDFIDQFDNSTPRLDIFFTLNFHEPFIIPETEKYDNIFRERLEGLNLEESRRAEIEQYDEIFRALLYTDDAIKELFERYRNRDDYQNTIFVITGDHRMIPVPHMNRIDRYYVPFMIYSPMLNESRQFAGVSSHLDFTPSILAYLNQNHDIRLPDSVHWLGKELNMSSTFSADRNVPFMRTKNSMPDYLSGRYFLSGDQLFELEEGMLLRPLNDPDLQNEIAEQFLDFKSMNHYVTSENKIIRVPEDLLQRRAQIIEEESFFIDNRLQETGTEELFYIARDEAFEGEYTRARVILRKVLRESPNFYDARLLLGRTYAWDGDYAEAHNSFSEVRRRNPDLTETYEALADLYYWQGDRESGLEMIQTGLQINANEPGLIYRKARFLFLADNREEAIDWFQRGVAIDPDHELKPILENQLQISIE